MTCKECEIRGKTWKGDNPKCAFDEKGMFKRNSDGSLDNWNCATLGKLRRFVREELSGTSDNAHLFNENENSATLIDFQGGYCFMQWYKSRGRTQHVFFAEVSEYVEEIDKFKYQEDMTDLELCEHFIESIEENNTKEDSQ